MCMWIRTLEHRDSNLKRQVIYSLFHWGSGWEYDEDDVNYTQWKLNKEYENVD